MNNIREARERAGFSQKQVAMALKVSAPTVSEWENGKKNPISRNLQKLSDMFGVSTDYLLGREETTKTEPITKIDDGLEDNAIIFSRNGKVIKRKYSKEQMDALRILIENMPAEDNEEL